MKCYACELPAEIECSVCGRPVCDLHAVTHRAGPDPADYLEVNVCPACGGVKIPGSGDGGVFYTERERPITVRPERRDDQKKAENTG